MMESPWIRSRAWDSWGILAAPFIAVLAVAFGQWLSPHWLQDPLQPLLWLFIVVAIDVAHVYSTAYRSYLNRDLWRRRPRLLLAIPLLGFGASCLLYHWSALSFWRVLAYMAVFHFVRQPYGLMMLYKRREKGTKLWHHRLDQTAIYAASVYPLVVWHLSGDRQFSWFMPGDFWLWKARPALPLVHGIAAAIAGLYLFKEWQVYRQTSQVNGPKNFVIMGTALAFSSGIIIWNSDVAFTLTNVISHGIPYLALIWIYDGEQFWVSRKSTKRSLLFGMLCFGISLGLLAYIEEGLWDAWVWTDHASLFPWFSRFFQPLSDDVLAWMVPLLALPQLTHYVLDGFIWKLQGAHGIKEPIREPKGAMS